VLVLSRRRGEIILIGDPPRQVELVVLAIRGEVVRLGLRAPLDVPIARSEIWERIKEVSCAQLLPPSGPSSIPSPPGAADGSASA